MQHVPTVTTVIDAAERIFAAFDIIGELTREQGFVTSEAVPAMRTSSGYQQRETCNEHVSVGGIG